MSVKIYRLEADRKIEEFKSSLGNVNVKIKLIDGSFIDAYPEYEDCKDIAIQKSTPLIEVYKIIQSEIRDKFSNNM